MLARAFAAGVPARWVVADSFYGRSGAFRRWLEERERAYAVMIPRTNAIDYQGRRIRVEQLAERLRRTGIPLAWLCLALSEECAAGMRRWLLIRRDADDPSARCLLARLRPGGDDRGGVGAGVRYALADRRMLRAGEGGGRHGPVRGAHLDGMAPLRDALPAGACRTSCRAGATPLTAESTRKRGRLVPA